jgi:hypothetical protein
MLILSGQVVKVSAGKPKQDDQGKPLPLEHFLYVQHNVNQDPDSDLELAKIKLKIPSQVDAFKKALGQNIQLPVRVWSSGDKSGFWLEQGVLPTVAAPRQS